MFGFNVQVATSLESPPAFKQLRKYGNCQTQTNFMVCRSSFKLFSCGNYFSWHKKNWLVSRLRLANGQLNISGLLTKCDTIKYFYNFLRQNFNYAQWYFDRDSNYSGLSDGLCWFGERLETSLLFIRTEVFRINLKFPFPTHSHENMRCAYAAVINLIISCHPYRSSVLHARALIFFVYFFAMHLTGQWNF